MPEMRFVRAQTIFVKQLLQLLVLYMSMWEIRIMITSVRRDQKTWIHLETYIRCLIVIQVLMLLQRQLLHWQPHQLCSKSMILLIQQTYFRLPLMFLSLQTNTGMSYCGDHRGFIKLHRTPPI
ncbi:uncharacterized protein LOC141710987 [Apium graveolens]|uniref:uncharacterized protein LOC141710987 n=1 Tax=Apium graveolens TaxID=4045 RepID=UPI003D791408